MPAANSVRLDSSSGSTSRFSCLYSAGATNAHSWNSVCGSDSRKAAIAVTFSGTKNGAATSVAIMCVPCGSAAISGCATSA